MCLVTDAIKEGIKKMPNAKEVWIHPDSAKGADSELYELGLIVRESILMPKDKFMMYDKSMTEVMEENLRRLHDWNE